MPQSSVEAIFLHGPKGAAMSRVEAAEARAGLGLEGDRYFRPSGNESDREITLIESEAVEALVRDEKVSFEVGESRRNVVTRGVALNHLVGREFTVGEARSVPAPGAERTRVPAPSGPERASSVRPGAAPCGTGPG